jgi:hypothetical protein
MTPRPPTPTTAIPAGPATQGPPTTSPTTGKINSMPASDGTTRGLRADGLPPTVPTHGWFMAMRSEDAFELIRANPFAFTLAWIIAARANWRGGFNRHNLEFGEAFLGDFESYGMSERNYRTAKEQLAKWNFATFRPTNKGTIAKLKDTRLFQINPPKGDGQSADSQRTADGQPTTNLNLKAGNQESNKAYSTKASKLSARQKELADRIEAALGNQWTNDAGKWINRIKLNPGKCERVIAEVENAIKENRIKTTPAQYAEEIWKEFAP